jgi:hypothetical protein
MRNSIEETYVKVRIVNRQVLIGIKDIFMNERHLLQFQQKFHQSL